MNNSIKKWYALYTKPGSEKKVANLLSRKNIENYCPLKRHGNARKKVVLEPLFSSYVFVQIEEAEMQSVRSIDCVINFIYWLGKPAIIFDGEIAIMKQFMNEYTNIKLEKIPFGVEGIRRVVAGSAGDFKIDMISVKNNTVKIVLPSLGYILLAEADKSSDVALPATGQSYTIVDHYQFAV